MNKTDPTIIEDAILAGVLLAMNHSVRLKANVKEERMANNKTLPIMKMLMSL